MTSIELRERADEEAEDLGPVPVDPRRRAIWELEKRGAIQLLAALAEWDSALLRRAALEIVTEGEARAATRLLLDAARIAQS